MPQDGSEREEVGRLREAVARMKEELRDLPRRLVEAGRDRARGVRGDVEEAVSGGLRRVRGSLHDAVVGAAASLAFALLALVGLGFLVAALFLALAPAVGAPGAALITGVATVTMGLGGLHVLRSRAR